MCRINRNLFHWVIENLIKNSIDAMDGEGVLKCSVKLIRNKAVVDITDNGKGVSRDQMKSILSPDLPPKSEVGVWVCLWLSELSQTIIAAIFM